MMYKKSLVSLLVGAAFAAPSFAQDTENTSKFDGTAELGFVMTGGNSDTSTINGKVELVNEEGPWKNTFSLEALRTVSQSADGVEQETADRIIISDQVDYKLSEKSYALGSIEYDQDGVSPAYDYFTNFTVGYGRKLINDDDMKLDLEIGVGQRDTTFIDGSSKDETLARFTGKFSWKISETASFKQSLRSDIGDETRNKSVSSLSLKINSKFSMKTSFTAEHFTGAVAPTDSLDTKVAITLVYSL
jgi:putative salt-induced outer membrane protein